MKYRIISRSDVEQKKEQYFDTIKIIHETIEKAKLDDNKESFEFAKDILIFIIINSPSTFAKTTFDHTF